MNSIYYPPANRTAQWRGDGNSTMTKVNKVLLHSTETRGWPPYLDTSPGGHPTLTYDPWLHQFRQHCPINGSATALANDGHFLTNRSYVCQVEIVGYCDPRYAAGDFNVRNLDARAVNDLAQFLVFMNKDWGVPIARAVDWPDYPASYGERAAQRMTDESFASFAGVCGHMHAPGNAHGDPGLIPIDKIIARAKELIAPPPPPPNPVKGWWHTTTTVNMRSKPIISPATVKKVQPKGHNVYVVDQVTVTGRRWLKSNLGNYYAREYMARGRS